MQVDIKNVFNNVLQVVICRWLCDVGGPLESIVPFIRLFYDTYYPLYYQHRWHVEGVTMIESSLITRQGDPLGAPLHILAHYQIVLKTITRAPTYVFPYLAYDTHIVGPMNEISRAFDHLSTQLAQLGLRVKVSKCKF
jgi:hypothetical protein